MLMPKKKNHKNKALKKKLHYENTFTYYSNEMEM